MESFALALISHSFPPAKIFAKAANPVADSVSCPSFVAPVLLLVDLTRVVNAVKEKPALSVSMASPV